MASNDSIWDDQLTVLKSIERAGLIKQFGEEEGTKLFEELNSPDFVPPEDIDLVNPDPSEEELARFDFTEQIEAEEANKPPLKVRRAHRKKS